MSDRFQGKCICFEAECTVTFSSRNKLHDHFIAKQTQAGWKMSQLRSIFDFYVSAFFLLDTSYQYSRYAHCCKLCARHVGPSQKAAETTKVEDIAHISEHYAVPERYCPICDVWLSSEKAANAHDSDCHQNASKTIKGEVHLERYKECKDAYIKFVSNLRSQRQSSLDSVSDTNRIPPKKKQSARETQPPIIQTVLAKEKQWRSIAELEENALDVFNFLGDFNFIGLLIIGSAEKDVNLVCSKLSNADIKNMLFHPIASSPLVCLLVCTTDTKFWSRFIVVLQENREAIYASPCAAMAIRRLMTNCETNTISDVRAIEIGVALVPNDSAYLDAALINSSYASQLFWGFATRNDHPARLLANLFKSKVVMYANDKYTFRAYRTLIIVAAEHAELEHYTQFLEATVESFNSIVSDASGAYVAQTLLLHYTKCHVVLNIASRDWIFNPLSGGVPMFQNANCCYAVQLVLRLSSSDLSDALWRQFEALDIYEMLCSTHGSYILRQIASMLTKDESITSFLRAVERACDGMNVDRTVLSCTQDIRKRKETVLYDNANAGVPMEH